MPKRAEPEPNWSKSRPERTIPSAFRASFGCSADSHPPDSSREWRCRTTYPMGSSRYDDSESITFIFFRATKFFAEFVKSLAGTAERSAKSRIENQRKTSGNFLLQLHGAGSKGGGCSSHAQYPSIDNESKLNFYITWNYVRLSFRS